MKKLSCICIIMTALWSCNFNESKPIDKMVLDIIHSIPEMTEKEYSEYFTTVETMQEILLNSKYDIDEFYRKRFLKAIDRYKLEFPSPIDRNEELFYRRNTRERFLELFEEYEIRDVKGLLLLNFEEKPDNGIMEREQFFSYGDKKLHLRINYMSFEGRNYLLGLENFRCEEGCETSIN